MQRCKQGWYVGRGFVPGHKKAVGDPVTGFDECSWHQASRHTRSH